MTQPEPSKESLERAQKFLDEQLELRSPMHSWLENLALEFDAIGRERDKVMEKLKRELEKAEGQLDIILRECQGDDDASLANDYGGTGWEKEVPVATVRWHRNKWKKSNEAAEKLAEVCKNLKSELLVFIQGEVCDHSVGICYCSTFRSLEDADTAIAAWKEEHQ